MYITIAAYAKKHNLSPTKVKCMVPKLSGAKQCPFCKKWQIPSTATPIYIPDKRKYKHFANKYCYIMDSIALNMKLDNDLSGISNNEITTILKELEKEDLIILKQNVKSTKYKNTDYELSRKGIDWANKQTKDKSKVILEIFKAIQTVANTVETIATVLKKPEELT